jgi:hypothetical protein
MNTDVKTGGYGFKPAEDDHMDAFDQEAYNLHSHLITLDEGLYCLWNETDSSDTRSLGVFGVQVKPFPADLLNIKVGGFRQDGWLNTLNDEVFVKVANKKSRIVLLTYQRKDCPTALTNIKVQRVIKQQKPAKADVLQRENYEILVHDVIAHVKHLGDIGAKFEQIVGQPGSQRYIQGFSINGPQFEDKNSLMYQAYLGNNWLSPPFKSGEFCGSRGMDLALLGYKVKCSEEFSMSYDIEYFGYFSDGSRVGPCGNDEPCRSNVPNAELEAMMVSIRPRGRAADGSQ